MNNKTAIEKLLEMSVHEFEFSMRASNALSALKVTTIGELCQLTEQNLLWIRGCGRKTVREIKERLEGVGVALKSRGFEDKNLGTRARRCLDRAGIPLDKDAIKKELAPGGKLHMRNPHRFDGTPRNYGWKTFQYLKEKMK